MRFKIKKKEVLFMIINIFIKLMYLKIIKNKEFGDKINITFRK